MPCWLFSGAGPLAAVERRDATFDDGLALLSNMAEELGPTATDALLGRPRAAAVAGPPSGRLRPVAVRLLNWSFQRQIADLSAG